MNDQMLRRRFRSLGATGLAALTLIGCGESKQAATASAALPSPSAGQVAAASAAPKVSFYAASRFAEQASFGPTPALVAELQAKGFEKWIDEQLALPASLIDAAPVANPAPTNPVTSAYMWSTFGGLAMTAPDPLRLRVSWSLAQYIVVMGTNIGRVNWFNLLQRRAFGRYGELLRDLSVDASMGNFLDNAKNRPRSPECPSCAPNENFARELMQLFSLGLYQLNPDGTPVLDARGRKIETYTQRDVEELARALTGWTHDIRDPSWPDDWVSRPLIPSLHPTDRDSAAKTVLGRSFPAGQSQQKDLDDTVAMLMAHANIAPFVGLRLIQHLVKSSPSPAYVGRVAAAFRNNGSGVAGDMKATLKAVLLDPEARRGDDPAQAARSDGKYREPVLWHWHFFRAVGCQRALYTPRTDGLDPFWEPIVQVPFRYPNVFGYYQAGDRSPGATMLAPEQRLVTSAEISSRFSALSRASTRQGERVNSIDIYERSGCDLQPLINAFQASPQAFTELVSMRFFRGAMPAPLRRTVEEMMGSSEWRQPYAPHTMLNILGWALSTPHFGVML